MPTTPAMSDARKIATLGHRFARRLRATLSRRQTELFSAALQICQLRGLGRERAVGERQVPVHIPEPVPETLAELRDNVVGGVAVFAGVTAVLDQCDRGVRRSYHMIAGRVHRKCEPGRANGVSHGTKTPAR